MFTLLAEMYNFSLCCFKLVLLYLIALTLVASGLPTQPTDCIVPYTTVLDLSKCFDNFIKPEGHINATTWSQTLPTDTERTAWNLLVQDVLTFVVSNSSSSSSCSDGISIPPELSDHFVATDITSTLNNISYCVIYEKTLDAYKRFFKGWGWFITPRHDRDTQRYLYMGIPHPQSDGPVHYQGAAMLERIGAKFLHIPGMRRDSYKKASHCQSGDYITDGAHDNTTMFHTTNLATMQWHFANVGQCPWSKCAFIQLHGKANTSCPDLDVFISASVDRTILSLILLYSNPSLPANKLQRELRAAGSFENFAVATTFSNNCDLRATTNIFGRVLNNVPIGQECAQNIDLSMTTGYFVHAEQAYAATEQESYTIWENGLKNAFSNQSINF